MRSGQDLSVELGNGLTIVLHNQPQLEWQDHHHDCNELIIPLLGKLVVAEKTAKHIVKPGSMIWIPQGMEHAAQASDAAGERLIFLIPSDSWNSRLPKVQLIARHSILVELGLWLVFNAGSESAKQLEPAILLILKELLLPRAGAKVSNSRRSLPKAKDARLLKALDYIVQHLGDDLRLPLIAKIAGASERTLDRLSAKELDQTIPELIRELRIDQAKSMLQSGHSVTEAAVQVGYNSVSQFIRVFRSLTGQLPSDFRRG
jgi:AraC-like DNA-binding protein